MRQEGWEGMGMWVTTSYTYAVGLGWASILLEFINFLNKK
jgi:hypothetical protein